MDAAAADPQIDMVNGHKAFELFAQLPGFQAEFLAHASF
jgi:hypothetical protein